MISPLGDLFLLSCPVTLLPTVQAMVWRLKALAIRIVLLFYKIGNKNLSLVGDKPQVLLAYRLHLKHNQTIN